jgi:L-lactate dehydrogenase (cytochrome)
MGLAKLADLLTIDDMRAQARRTTPRMLFDFIDGAARDATAHRNSASFQSLALIGSALNLTANSVRAVDAMQLHQAAQTH